MERQKRANKDEYLILITETITYAVPAKADHEIEAYVKATKDFNPELHKRNTKRKLEIVKRPGE